MKHTKWKEYVEGVGNGSIVAGRLIKLAVLRFNSFMERDDMYFDEDEVDRAVDFISIIKHFLGKSAGKNFILEPWQEWFIAFILGFKWKDTGYRVVRNVYFQVARKALDVSTPVLTTTGWTTMGDIQVGDYVYDAEGKPTQVVYTTPVFKGDCYDITFDDGETIRADAGHEWTVKPQKSRSYVTATTEEIYKRYDGKVTVHYYPDGLKGKRKTTSVKTMVKAPSTMVRCITVDNDKHQFLCGKSLIVNNNCGKDSLAAAIALYMLIVDGEASPEIACLANSREQARILFKYITQYAKSIDGKGKILKEYRNYITMPSNNGEVKVFSADASKLDGLNVSCGIIDEYHEAKSRALYDVIASSMLQRTQPLMIVITTAGFDLQSPCHDMYMLGVEILEGIKEDDTFLPVIFQLDEDDDWKDMENTEVWKKCQPNLGVTVTVDAMRAEVKKALNDSTAINGVLTKTFNKWVSSSLSWIPSEIVAKCMGRRVDLNDYAGQYAVIGMDCGSVSDFTSISVCIPQPMVNEYVFKSWTFIPNVTYENSPRKELYKKFVDEGSMIITDGNVCDYDYIQRKIGEIGNVLMIDAIYSDAWNATSLLTSLQDSGYNVLPFSQAIGNFNAPTKEMERLIRESRAIIDKSQNVLWQFGNVELKVDSNGNAKPNKGVGKGSNEAYAKKIDSVISMCTALGGLLKGGYTNDLRIDVF